MAQEWHPNLAITAIITQKNKKLHSWQEPFAQLSIKNRTFAAQCAVNNRHSNIFDRIGHEQYNEAASRHTRV